MRALIFIFSLFFLTNLNARFEDDDLQIAREGFVIVVVDFKEGDKIKMFEVETGDHILSKTRGQIDLSQLPSGKYLLENSEGKSVVIEKSENDIVIEKELGTEYIVEYDSESMSSNDVTVEEELEEYYLKSELNPLGITRNGDVITVVDFLEGDKIKLFEMIGKIHVLSKTTEVVDLTQLATGKYILENDRGQSVVVEKFDVDLEFTETVAFN
ncbi:hypothetical protein D1815_10365 [Aquimarina sp. AD1]|uniref:hypothetical protein n=1 Tax=Aquimarina sp. (strain AD1) TaxID=1714848 RepID=UPI000E519E29|nr:hypothetical protein [Aquimarina sp. AD1]AXT56136.1 hypothetical protein D1815_10365 [Aquimarina sp. AD1]RKN21956.1 hypothetical protein D7035_12245 [Aquimarina sp. AD1]